MFFLYLNDNLTVLQSIPEYASRTIKQEAYYFVACGKLILLLLFTVSVKLEN
jgi:hypothetical protein